MAVATSSVAWTMIGAVTFGQMWRPTIASGDRRDPRGRDVLPLPDGQGLSPGQPGDGRRGDEADRDHHVADARAERRRDRQRQDQAGERLHGVNEAHDTSSVCRQRTLPASPRITPERSGRCRPR